MSPDTAPTPAGAAPRSPAFSPARLLRLAAQQGREHLRAWLAFALVLGIVLALVALLMLLLEPSSLRTPGQVLVYYLGLYISAYLFAHRLLGVWQRRETALVYLMLPAGTAEKWLLMCGLLLLAYPLVYTLVYTLVFWPAAALAVQLQYQEYLLLYEELGAAAAHAKFQAEEALKYQLYLPLRPSSESFDAPDWRGQLATALAYAGLTGYAAATLSYFKRHAGLRAVVLALGIALGTFVVAALAGEDRWFRVIYFWLSNGSDWDKAVTGLEKAIALSVWLGVPALLWAASYRAQLEKDLT